MKIFGNKFKCLHSVRPAESRARAGFTLIEVLVSVTLFTIIMLSATSIFKLVLDAQKKSVSAQNVQEGLRYFMEVIGKEIRMAQRDNGQCDDVPDNQIFEQSSNSAGDILYFKNYHGQCVHYYLFGSSVLDFYRFTVSRDNVPNYISPVSVDISNLRFIVHEATGTQAYVTLSFKAEAVTPNNGRDSDIYVQTSVASRYYLDN